MSSTSIYELELNLSDSIVIDSLSTADVGLEFVVLDPFGQEIYVGNSNVNSNPILALHSGAYQIVVREEADIATAFTNTAEFRLLKVTDFVVEPGQTVTAQLPREHGAQVFRFVSKGRETFLRPIRDKQFVSAASLRGLATHLQDDLGGPSDGYVGIDAAIGELDYREGSARQIVLVTDRDREPVSESLDFESIRERIDELNAELSTILNAEFETATGEKAIGIRANGNAVSIRDAGSYDESPNGVVVNLTGQQAYADLSWNTNGVVWDLNLFPIAGDSANAVRDVFAEVTAESLADDFSIDVVASNSSVKIQNRTGQLPALTPSQLLEFEIEFTERAASGGTMDLRFERTGTGTLVGSIPVRLVDTFVYNSSAVDPDGDQVQYSLLDSPTGANINPNTGRLVWKPESVGVFNFQILANDGKGGEAIQAFAVNVIES